MDSRRSWSQAAAAIGGRLPRVSALGSRAPTWGLALLVLVLSWSVQFGTPRGGIDGSFGAGLYMATHGDLDFGTDVVFTYGPLGFLSEPVGWYGDLAAMAFLFQVALSALLAFSLVWTLRRAFGALGATAAALLALVLIPSPQEALVIATVWCLACLAPRPPRYPLAILIGGGASLAAIEMLVKLSVGPVIFAICLLTLLGARARPWQLGLYLGLFIGGLSLLWVAVSQDLAGLTDYLRNGVQIVSGYSEAMVATSGSPAVFKLGLAAAVVALLGTIIAAAMPSYSTRLARWCAAGVMGLAAFAAFKQGMVRFAEVRLIVYFSTLGLLWLAIPWQAGKRWLLSGGAIALVGMTVILSHGQQPGQTVDRLNVVDHVELAANQTESLFSPDERASNAEISRALFQEGYQLDEATVNALSGQSVMIDPWEIAVAWAYQLEWSPAPVFQNYSAFTAHLDQLNAAAIASPTGPERILRHLVPASSPTGASLGLDGRFRSWDPPAQALAELCNFVPLHTTSRWQVLGRTVERCGEPELISSIRSSYGEAVRVPAAEPGKVVFARIYGAGVEGVEKVRTLLYRANFRFAVLDGADRFRLVPGTVEDGLLLRGAPRLVGEGHWMQAPQAETIELEGVEGELRFDFFEMAVSGARRR